jgi:hypothetical protein
MDKYAPSRLYPLEPFRFGPGYIPRRPNTAMPIRSCALSDVNAYVRIAIWARADCRYLGRGRPGGKRFRSWPECSVRAAGAGVQFLHATRRATSPNPRGPVILGSCAKRSRCSLPNSSVFLIHCTLSAPTLRPFLRMPVPACSIIELGEFVIIVERSSDVTPPWFPRSQINSSFASRIILYRFTDGGQLTAGRSVCGQNDH